MARDGVKFKIDGLDELRAKFADVTEAMSVSAANAGARNAARLVARAAYRGALKIDDPETGEQIARNIWAGGARYPGVRKRSRRSTKEGEVAYRVGVAGGAISKYANTAHNRRQQRVGKEYFHPGIASKDSPGGDTWYWRLIEFGSENNQAEPFLRPALSENTQAATNEFLKEYEKALDRAVKRRAKKQAQALR